MWMPPEMVSKPVLSRVCQVVLDTSFLEYLQCGYSGTTRTKKTARRKIDRNVARNVAFHGQSIAIMRRKIAIRVGESRRPQEWRFLSTASRTIDPGLQVPTKCCDPHRATDPQVLMIILVSRKHDRSQCHPKFFCDHSRRCQIRPECVQASLGFETIVV